MGPDPGGPFAKCFFSSALHAVHQSGAVMRSGEYLGRETASAPTSDHTGAWLSPQSPLKAQKKSGRSRVERTISRGQVAEGTRLRSNLLWALRPRRRKRHFTSKPYRTDPVRITLYRLRVASPAGLARVITRHRSGSKTKGT
jgi:hypothetical protein